MYERQGRWLAKPCRIASIVARLLPTDSVFFRIVEPDMVHPLGILGVWSPGGGMGARTAIAG
jgi:hypothetical protein